MELHVHLAATHTREPWVEHFEWLEPLFEERLEIRDGRMLVPTRPGLIGWVRLPDAGLGASSIRRVGVAAGD